LTRPVSTRSAFYMGATREDTPLRIEVERHAALLAKRHRPSVESLQIKVARVGFVVGSGSRAAPTPWHLTSRAGPEPDRPNRRNESVCDQKTEGLWSDSLAFHQTAKVTTALRQSGPAVPGRRFSSTGTWGVERWLRKIVGSCYEGDGGFRNDSRRSCARGRLRRRCRSPMKHRASSQKFQSPPPPLPCGFRDACGTIADGPQDLPAQGSIRFLRTAIATASIRVRTRSLAQTFSRYAEIAAARGLNVKTVEWRMSKALEHCVARLDD